MMAIKPARASSEKFLEGFAKPVLVFLRIKKALTACGKSSYFY